MSFFDHARETFDESRSLLPAPETESPWATRLPDGSFLFEPQGGLWPGRRFRVYVVVIRDGRVKRVSVGSDEAELRIFVTEQGVRSQHAFDYRTAHRFTWTELETQIYEAEPFQPGSSA